MIDRSGANGTPDSVDVFMYDVGFGDCFLLSLRYAGGASRHVLIDCGSRDRDKEEMDAVAARIASDTGNHVDAMVITHRHSDHLSAFGLKDAGKRLSDLKPDLVLQPWTEDPDIPADATAPVGDEWTESHHIAALSAGQGLADELARKPSALMPAAGPEVQRTVSFIAGLNITNKRALQRIASLSGEHRYLYAGCEMDVEELLPGVRVSVLGPPTLEDCADIARQTHSNPEEFWKLQQQAFAAADGRAAA